MAGGWWLVAGVWRGVSKWLARGGDEGVAARLRRREHRGLGRREDGAAREARRRRRRGAAGRSGFLGGGEEGTGARTRRPGRLQALQVEPGVCQPGVPGVMCRGRHHWQSGAPVCKGK